VSGLAVALVLGSVLTGALAGLSVSSAPPRLVRDNYRGERVPVVLGLALLGGAVAGALTGLLIRGADPAPAPAAVVVGLVVLGAAGALDDMQPDGPRGLRGHLAGLIRGRPSTGILKLILGVAGAIAVAVLLGGEPARIAAAAVLMAVSVNLWNALDVVPGRSLKWAALVLLVVVAVAPRTGLGVAAGAALGASVGALPFDLTERGMLGDAGSNPLGFVAGSGLAAILPTVALIGAAVAALALQVAAETVTISRLIEAVPPLRWFDRLGRRP
jgi:hypothetical protein